MSTPVEPALMRETMRLWASGVSVVTSAHGNERSGLTVSAFNSLSLQPPMILICLHKDSQTIPLIEQSGVFAVSFLSSTQTHLSDRFAGRVPLGEGEDRFTGVETFTAATGAPVIAEAIGWVDCKVASKHDGSTHWIYIGEVYATGQNPVNSDPLLYFNRAYRAMEKEAVS
ncbi:MAG: flavin reductase family protein [Chloroflexota bacterium]|nr:flavin reductase family protein [Chloroflexota bacterium]